MKNVIALGILVVLGVVALLVFRERPAEDKAKLDDVIKPVSLDKLDTIKIRRQEGTGDEKKEETYTLKKTGDAWRMVEPVDYAVVSSSVDSMTKALSELKIVDVISEKAANHEKFKVDDKEGVEVTALSGNETLAHLILGSSRNGFTFARVPKKDPVYRLKGSMSFFFNKAGRMLREKEILKLDMKDLKQVTFEKGEEKLTFAREGEEGSDVIKPVGVEIKNFDESKAKGVVRSLTSLNTIDFQDEPLPDEKTGLGEDAVKVVIEYTKDDKPVESTLLVGAKDEEKKKTYAKLADNQQVFLISDYTANRLKFQASDYAKTDEEVAKAKKAEEEAKARAASAPPGGPMGGPPGQFKVTPEMMKQLGQH
jgi:hypothetical protein